MAPVDWPTYQDDHWRTVTMAREQDDRNRRREFEMRREESQRQLRDSYNSRNQLKIDLEAVERSIKIQEAEQERLIGDHETAQAQLKAQRQEEDRKYQEQLGHGRYAGNKENGQPKNSSEGPSRRAAPPNLPIAPGMNGTAGWTSINGSRRRTRRDDEQEPPADPGNLLSSIYHNPIDEDDSPTSRVMPMRIGTDRSQPSTSSNSIATAEPEASVDDAYRASRSKDRFLKPKQQRHSLPSVASIVRSPGRLPMPDMSLEPEPKSFTGRKSLPGIKGSDTPTASIPAEDEENNRDVQEITGENLIIRDNGTIITEPPMFAGIPLERIDEDHPYWNPEWEPLESIILPQLAKWEEKLEVLRQQSDAVRHTVFLANRQVNRGQSIMDHLKAKELHPYQFVGKEMMEKFYKTYTNYDTLFRFVNVYDELKKFDLDMKPIDWLRHRMYEIAMEQGEKFSLSKTTHDFYHDAKLKLLREKHGFGNIGRPSGYKLGERDPTRSRVKVKKEPSERKSAGRKKGRRSIGQVEAGDSPQQGQAGPSGEYLEPVTPRLQKRQRLETTFVKQEEADQNLEYDGYTSTDSFSAGRIMHLDWRVYQIKTRALTTSVEVTQYWTWKPDQNKFEHQVLRDVYPKVTWGFYREPTSFDLTLEEVKEIRYAPDSQKIQAIITDEKRGNVLAHFKRERTKRRFLTFAQKKGMQLVKYTPAQIEDAWDAMTSETLPDDEVS